MLLEAATNGNYEYLEYCLENKIVKKKDLLRTCMKSCNLMPAIYVVERFNNRLTEHDYARDLLYSTIEIMDYLHYFIKIDTLEKAKNVPCIFNNWANFYKGEFISNTILNAKSFEKLMTKIKEE